MFKILGKNVLRTSAFALACFALAGMDVKADLMTTTMPVTSSTVPSETYTTTVSIANTGVTGTPDITFTGIGNASNSSYGSFGLGATVVQLGTFRVTADPVGATTTYNNTPFTITYTPAAITGTSADAFPNTTILLTGVLNGTVSSNTSTVSATFNSVNSPVFSTPDGNFVSTISLPPTAGGLASPTNSGNKDASGNPYTDTTLNANIATTAAAGQPSLGTSTITPEPTTLAILGTAIVGLSLRQRLRKGRQGA